MEILIKITIILLTIIYLILTIIAIYIDKYVFQIGQTLSTKEFVRLCSIRDIYRIISSIVLIIDIAFILVFFL